MGRKKKRKKKISDIEDDRDEFDCNIYMYYKKPNEDIGMCEWTSPHIHTPVVKKHSLKAPPFSLSLSLITPLHHTLYLTQQPDTHEYVCVRASVSGSFSVFLCERNSFLDEIKNDEKTKRWRRGNSFSQLVLFSHESKC